MYGMQRTFPSRIRPQAISESVVYLLVLDLKRGALVLFFLDLTSVWAKIVVFDLREACRESVVLPSSLERECWSIFPGE